jgi:hypothetical protein
MKKSLLSNVLYPLRDSCQILCHPVELSGQESDSLRKTRQMRQNFLKKKVGIE